VNYFYVKKVNIFPVYGPFFNIFAGIVGQDRKRKLTACFIREGKT
jgi:hypothetical protein